jgi:hypothetical protein
MVFTTHGDFVQRRLPTQDFDYGLTREQIERIGIDYTKTGYGFEDYRGEKNYGVSLTSPEWIRARVRELGGLREVYFKECGWDNHQDVFGFVRESRTPPSRPVAKPAPTGTAGASPAFVE